MKLIGITGKARSGKDTAAEHIINEYEYEKYSFADPLKRACSEMFGIPLGDFYNDNLKDEVNEFWGISPRRMAQLLGTEGGRKLFREDLWIKRAELYIRGQDKIIIPDVRFENEANFIRANGGALIHIKRKDLQSVEQHISEAGVLVCDNDYTVHNYGSVYDLHFALDAVIHDAGLS